jgi:hypothetical protein
MAKKDKNDENASERIARKFFFATESFIDCNTRCEVDLYNKNQKSCVLYSSLLAQFNSDTNELTFFEITNFSGSLLTKSRVKALKNEANRRNITIIGE